MSIHSKEKVFSSVVVVVEVVLQQFTPNILHETDCVVISDTILSSHRLQLRIVVEHVITVRRRGRRRSGGV